MDQKLQIKSAIIDAIQEVNQTLPAERKMSTQEDAELYGSGSSVDSLTVTLLIVAIEQKLEQSMGQMVTLVDYSVGLSPLKSITTLCDYISHLIEKNYVP